MAVTSRAVYSNMKNLVNILHRKWDPILHLEQVSNPNVTLEVYPPLVYVCPFLSGSAVVFCSGCTSLGILTRCWNLFLLLPSPNLMPTNNQEEELPWCMAAAS